MVVLCDAVKRRQTRGVVADGTLRINLNVKASKRLLSFHAPAAKSSLILTKQTANIVYSLQVMMVSSHKQWIGRKHIADAIP